MIKNIILKNKHYRFLIAYSGGIDSTVLLHQMIDIKNIMPNIKIRAIHVNHNMHPSSNIWSKHCKLYCKNYQINLITEQTYINKNKNNIEERLRQKRYNIFYANLLEDEILLTGHHLHDQCETLILSLKRGSGVTGLSGMHEESTFGTKKILRPLLNISRNTIKIWAEKKK